MQNLDGHRDQLLNSPPCGFLGAWRQAEDGLRPNVSGFPWQLSAHDLRTNVAQFIVDPLRPRQRVLSFRQRWLIDSEQRRASEVLRGHKPNLFGMSHDLDDSPAFKLSVLFHNRIAYSGGIVTVW